MNFGINNWGLSIWLLLCMVATPCAAIEFGVIETELTDQTVLVAVVDLTPQAVEVGSYVQLPFDIDLSMLGNGETAIIVSANDVRIIMDDPSGNRLKTFVSLYSKADQWESETSESRSIIKRTLFPQAHRSRSLSKVNQQRWMKILDGSNGQSLFIAVAPAVDVHRVLTELALADPILGDSGISKLQTITLGLEPTNFELKLVARCADPALAAQVSRQMRMSAQTYMKGLLAKQSVLIRSLDSLFQSKPTIDGETITFVHRFRPNEVALRLKQQRNQQVVTQIRNVLIGSHNFNSAFKRIPGPPAANEANSGLSWRVAILPFIDQGDLYKQFELDQPWDSPRNRKLIAKIPAAYRHPESKLQRSSGMSNFVVPTGPGLLHGGDQTVAFDDIPDGQANTLMVLVANDDHAEIWTKPVAEEGNINLASPTLNLMVGPAKEMLFGFSNGRVESLTSDISDERLRAWLTIDGGEAGFDSP